MYYSNTWEPLPVKMYWTVCNSRNLTQSDHINLNHNSQEKSQKSHIKVRDLRFKFLIFQKKKMWYKIMLEKPEIQKPKIQVYLEMCSVLCVWRRQQRQPWSYVCTSWWTQWAGCASVWCSPSGYTTLCLSPNWFCFHTTMKDTSPGSSLSVSVHTVSAILCDQKSA